MSESTRRRIALIVESSRSYGRDVLRGIAQYSRLQGNWSLVHEEMTLDASLPGWIAEAGLNGVIARVDEHNVEPLRELGVPIVDVRCRYAYEGIPQIETDDRAVAELAFNHLWQRGFRRFAFCGYRDAHYSENRLRFFRGMAEASGCPFSVYLTSGNTRTISSIERAGYSELGSLSAWLQSLAPVTGVLACNDIRGQQLLNASRYAETMVPEEIGVVGVDDDDTLCQLCDPPLSSVRPDGVRVGYRAAETLDELMKGAVSRRSMELVKPLGVSQRLSTQVTAVDDRELARVCRFIREHACSGIDVSNVVEFSSLSRRALERRFRAKLGRTPHEELMAVHIMRVKEMLGETACGLEEVALMAGYSHRERLGVVFKRETGMTPGEYRRRLKGDG